MRRMLTAMLAVSLVTAGVPGTVFFTATVSARGQAVAAISGVVVNCQENAVASARVRLRSTTTNEIVAEAKTNAKGQFSFAGVTSGYYMAEVVSADGGGLLGSSQPLTALGGASVANAQIRTSEGCGGGFMTSTAGVLTMAAIAAGITVAAIAAGDKAATAPAITGIPASTPAATATPAAVEPTPAVTPLPAPTTTTAPTPSPTTSSPTAPSTTTTPAAPADNPFHPTQPCNPVFHDCGTPPHPPASPHS